MDTPSAESDPPVEHSSLERWLTLDHVTVHVRIYRVPTEDIGWTLEVMEPSSGSTRWPEAFESEGDAFGAFIEVVAEHGMQSFVKKMTRH